MFRTRWLVSLSLGLLLLGGALLPVQAANILKFTLVAGTHELVISGDRYVISNSDDLVVQIASDGNFISGVIAAADGVTWVHVRIVRVGTPDEVIYDGNVSSPTEFDSNSDETGHAEM